MMYYQNNLQVQISYALSIVTLTTISIFFVSKMTNIF